MASVKSNVLLNSINTITGIVFPVITFPYAARVLLPEGIGAVNFLNSVIGYIVLLTSLGIPMYAVKEVAKYRDNKENRDRITVEIIILSIILCLFGYVAVLLLAQYVPRIHEQIALFYVLSLSIVFTSIGVNWFYQGVEDFKFITIRAIIIRTLSAASLFIFVKRSSDLLIYGFIIVGSSVGNNIINFTHLRKYIDLAPIKFRDLNIVRHIRPACEVFILNLIISLYVNLNSIMLGFLSGDRQVGFFTAGTKITHVGLTVISSLATVLLPRCSHLIKIGDHAGFSSIINKSLRLTLLLSLPMMSGIIVLAVPLTIIFCGDAYMESIPILYMNAPVIVFISLTNVMGIQVLYPKDKTKIVIWSVTGGAVCNLMLNLMLIPPYGAIGAAISTLIAEFSVLCIQIILGKNYYPFRIKSLINIRYILASLIMTAFIECIIYPLHSDMVKLAVAMPVGVIVYFTVIILFKDSLTLEVLSTITNRFNHGKKI